MSPEEARDSINRAPVTVRMRPALKETFERAAIEAGMELGTAARQLMELFAARLQHGTDYLDAIGLVKDALRVSDPRKART